MGCFVNCLVFYLQECLLAVSGEKSEGESSEVSTDGCVFKRAIAIGLAKVVRVMVAIVVGDEGDSMWRVFTMILVGGHSAERSMENWQSIILKAPERVCYRLVECMI